VTRVTCPPESRRLTVKRLSCEETFRRLDDFVDRELAPEEMAMVREHLEGCAVCASEYRFEAGVLAAVKSKLRRLAAPADLLQRISERIHNAGERG
jgi:anti-sigma factor (TIGR02949 family)